jgi:hypothetical protein
MAPIPIKPAMSKDTSSSTIGKKEGTDSEDSYRAREIESRSAGISMAQEIPKSKVYNRTKEHQHYTRSRTPVFAKRKIQMVSDNSFKNKYHSLEHEEGAKKAGSRVNGCKK